MNIDYDDVGMLDIQDELIRIGIITKEQVNEKSVEIDEELYEKVNDYVEENITSELQYKVEDLMYESLTSFFEDYSVKSVMSIVLDD
jgi:hypothetical protein